MQEEKEPSYSSLTTPAAEPQPTSLPEIKAGQARPKPSPPATPRKPQPSTPPTTPGMDSSQTNSLTNPNSHPQSRHVHCQIPLPACLTEANSPIYASKNKTYNDGLRTFLGDVERARGNLDGRANYSLLLLVGGKAFEENNGNNPIQDAKQLQDVRTTAKSNSVDNKTTDEFLKEKLAGDSPLPNFVRTQLTQKGLDQLIWTDHQDFFYTPMFRTENAWRYLHPEDAEEGLPLPRPTNTVVNASFDKDNDALCIESTSLGFKRTYRGPDPDSPGATKLFYADFLDDPDLAVRTVFRLSNPQDDPRNYQFRTNTTTNSIRLARESFQSCLNRKTEALAQAKKQEKSAPSKADFLLSAYQDIASYSDDDFIKFLTQIDDFPNNPALLDSFVAETFLTKKVMGLIEKLQQQDNPTSAVEIGYLQETLRAISRVPEKNRIHNNEAFMQNLLNINAQADKGLYKKQSLFSMLAGGLKSKESPVSRSLAHDAGATSIPRETKSSIAKSPSFASFFQKPSAGSINSSPINDGVNDHPVRHQK